MDALLAPAKAKAKPRGNVPDAFDAEMEDAAPEPALALANGTKVRVYWTDLRKWYTATVVSSKAAKDERGQPYRLTKLKYDAADGWTTDKELTYSHCLDDETWSLA